MSLNKELLVFNKGVRQYYPSNIEGTRIVNAITGIAYDDLVGSKKELDYFRVLDSSGKVNSMGYKLPFNYYNPNSNKLFYETKEEWEKHSRMRKLIIK